MSAPINVREVFLRAVDISSAEERAAFLDEVCSADDAVRKRIEALIDAHESAESLLDKVPAESGNMQVDVTLDTSLSDTPGSMIGPYKLLQEIGEGGMGVVYMAEQQDPIRRRVALKIIKPGMDSRQVVARFEAERQALAMMDHPNIAKVFDAGTTENGRPCFAMELAKGVPVTQYCDENHLSPRERLQLFSAICDAVQHAHQKGIIHRDLKPTNVLVADYDHQAVPKIIDFGVAKALNQQLTEKTMFTQYGQIVGTPEYMSPEQAEFNQLDIDTRSDIYSLGVLLYELLSGETPFDRDRLRSAAFDELVRIIREEDPPKPSRRLKNSATLSKQERFDEAQAALLECEKYQQEWVTEYSIMWYWPVGLLGECRLGQERFAEAEPLLFKAYAGQKRYGSGTRDDFEKEYQAARRIVRLYEAWRDAEPDGGYDKLARDWRETLVKYASITSEPEVGVPASERL